MTSPDHRLALPQGTRVQDFEFHRILGHGGFGITYLGWNIALDIPVAIKEYLPVPACQAVQGQTSSALHNLLIIKGNCHKRCAITGLNGDFQTPKQDFKEEVSEAA